MRDKDLYAQILGLQSPWQVREVALHLDAGEVIVHVEHDPEVPLACPECGEPAPGYDARERRWRHLDTCQYRTILAAEVPRCRCSKHGVHQVSVPWGEAGSRFTALFEALVIDWLKEANVSAVGRNLGLSWDQVDGIMQRAVRRGMARRRSVAPERIGVDETSFKKRHKYVTVVHEQEHGHVLHVADGRGRVALDEFFKDLERYSPEPEPDQDEPDLRLSYITSISMDMHKPYIASAMEHIPDADHKIAFDRFHVSKIIGDGVDKVRRQEHAELSDIGNKALNKTKYLWLQNPRSMKSATRQRLNALKGSALRTARAWAIKEMASSLWGYISRGWAERGWKRLLSWIQRCRLEPMLEVGRTIRRHLWGIINAITQFASNADAESLNSKIQRIKRLACGYRNKERFRTAIMFHLGGLDSYPDGVLGS